MDHAQHLFNPSVGIHPSIASPILDFNDPQIPQISQISDRPNLRHLRNLRIIFFRCPFLFNNSHD